MVYGSAQQTVEPMWKDAPDRSAATPSGPRLRPWSAAGLLGIENEAPAPPTPSSRGVFDGHPTKLYATPAACNDLAAAQWCH